ncbi:stretch-activated cation channel mid1 [Modicella reniformis]|uniref:Stretch-activated cation channel mid1 n=1 Tax=Modicella reniformis TaxID=1440133 RepID=A0A9P6JG69_9FUNG|nr:stretch-activated cation channel mid1 [Modicella reniformis]
MFTIFAFRGIDRYVQEYQDSQGLVLDDTDNTSASFLTRNFTAVPTFKVYMINSTSLPLGLDHSLCAIEAVQPVPLTKTNMVLTQTNRTSNLDGSQGRLTLPREPIPAEVGQRRQVLIQSLIPGKEYIAFFVTDVLNQAGAEVMYAMTRFETKRNDNCVLITDLQFCHEVAYAVPVTPISTLPPGGVAPDPMTLQEIKQLYDGFANAVMGNFTNVLGQYDCSKSQYSLIRNCTDCERAYRRWLCSVSIPRCTDTGDVTDPKNLGYIHPEEFQKPDVISNPYLIDRSNGPVVVMRNTTTSRGAIKQSENRLMNPGEYGEVLPCMDLCYDVVQSCPHFLQFSCPAKNMAGNYAWMNMEGYKCNGLGLVPLPSGAASDKSRMMEVVAVVVVGVVILLF